MKKRCIAALAFVLNCASAFAQTDTSNHKTDFYNFGFEKVSDPKKLPDEWHIMSPNAKQYVIKVDSMAQHSGKNSIYIASVDTSTHPYFGGVGYGIPAKFEGKEITVSAWIKAEQVQRAISVMLNIYDADGNSLQFDNMVKKGLKGTKDWQKYSVTLPLSPDAQFLHIGTMLIGKGKLWADDVEVLVDGVPITEAKLKANFNPNKPRNLYGRDTTRGKFVKLKDATLYYETYGTGEPLLLLHGNSQSIYAFVKQIPDFSKKYKVIAVDTRGQGKSTDASTGPLSYNLFADDMKQLLDSLHISKINILGWSDGGNTGLIMAIKYPQLVNKLAVTGANLSPTTDAVSSEVLKSVKQALDQYNGKTDPKSIERKRLTELLLNEPHISYESLQTIKAPTLVMAGEMDMIKEAHTRAIVKNIPNSKLIIFKGATHYVPVEKVEEFNNAVLDFFETGKN